MKSFIIIGLCLVAVVHGQTTKKSPPKPPQGKAGSNDPCDPAKRPNADIKTCCPGYPDFTKAAFMQKCGQQCMSAAANKNLSICCLSKCYLSENKAINADGSINAANVVSTVLNYSTSKSKPTYSAFVTKVVDECIKVAKNISEKRKNEANNCITAYFEGCLMRGLFVNCPEASPNKACTDLQAYANSCKHFPMGPPGPPSGNKPQAAAASAPSGASNGKPPAPPTPNKQGQQATQNKSAAPTDKPTRIPPTPPKDQPPATPTKGQQVKSTPAPKNTPPAPTKRVTHPSESEHGALGKNGAGFKI